MIHQEGSFRGLNDHKLYYQCWLPTEGIKAVLVLVHGLADHSGRYRNLVQHLIPQGYAIYSYDQRGHGRSEGKRCYVNKFSEYIEDLSIFLELVCKEQPEKSIFLFGHSLGGTIAAVFASERQHKIAGLLLSGATLLIGSSITPAQIAMAKILARILPGFGIARLDAMAISRDESVVNAYINDPLVYRGKIPARWGVEMLTTLQALPSKLIHITLPVLVLQGAADRLSEPEGSHLLYYGISSKDKTLKLYPSLYHEVINEAEREQVLNDIAEWLHAHLH